MTTGGTGALVRRPDGSTRATLLELLFDVVFVASLALTSTLLAERHTWSTATMVLLMLTAIWWTWSVTATTTEFYDPQQRPIQAILMVAMVGSVGMGASLPKIASGHALVFAVAYVGTHVIRGFILITSLHQQRHRLAEIRATRFLFWFLVSGVFWIAGALFDTVNWTLWSIAIAIDLVSAAARYPTPGLGRVPFDQYERTTAHLGERYQQFVILALGDIILVPTLQVSRGEFTGLRVAALFCAFAVMLLLWQIYVFRAGELLEAGARAGRPARVAPYTHLVMLAGVVGTAASFDLVVARPTGTTPVGWLLLIMGGPALFVIGRVLFTLLVSMLVPWRRMLCLILPLLTLPWAGRWPPLLVTTSVALGLAAHILLPGAARETTPGLRVRQPDD
ncbi:low temperature requirement protein A [Micromonospora sp. M51]|uniref:Low temperature requirement protein A n=1 Tax=Micromonospora parva TaxID=1464048 RepID=A0ABW6VXR8_9ACTN|nr:MULTISPECIES: low temperature requirement protein A [Micromonospora]MBQ1013609.1 low temperature requirement protein A [Micromonospora sp. M51]MBQ1032488.1 low temperature requirement protein A [Micromonospora sp. C97]